MRITINDKFIGKLMKKTELPGTTLMSDALGLLSWAIEEVSKGKKIVSVDANTELDKSNQVVLRSLDAVKGKD